MLLFVLFFLLQTSRDARAEFLQEVNAVRTQGCTCGGEYFGPVNPVTWDETLEKTGFLHSKDMQTRDYFSHFSRRGKSPADRLKAQGYHYRSFAENLFAAKGYTPSVSEVVSAWKKSSNHCKNLMNNTVSEMGVGIYKGYYTQLFGSRQTK
ncbi:MAG: CAP domain-containing protein [Leadbetterella sp.]|nr:CAP domain-containing protein [Leadbetterella sp.]